MIIKSATFICSNTQVSKLPPPTMPEYAFIGRSNVGKSSLINMLTGKKGLAKTYAITKHAILCEEYFISGGYPIK